MFTNFTDAAIAAIQMGSAWRFCIMPTSSLLAALVVSRHTAVERLLSTIGVPPQHVLNRCLDQEIYEIDRAQEDDAVTEVVRVAVERASLSIIQDECGPWVDTAHPLGALSSHKTCAASSILAGAGIEEALESLSADDLEKIHLICVAESPATKRRSILHALWPSPTIASEIDFVAAMHGSGATGSASDCQRQGDEQ